MQQEREFSENQTSIYVFKFQFMNVSAYLCM